MSLNPNTPLNTPQEFADRLSERLLVQPDYEFIFARWAYGAALAAQMAGDPTADMIRMQMMEGRLPFLGGAGSPANMADAMNRGMGGPLLLSAGMTFPDLVVMVQEAKEPGEVIKINRPKYTDGATTESLRQLKTTDKIFGANSQAIQFEQVDVTILEVGGPGDATGAIVPIHIPRFTQHRSKHNLLVNVSFQLRRDRNKYVDDLLMNRLLNAASAKGNITRPAGIAGSSNYTAAGAEPMSFDLIVSAAESMKTRKVPGVGGAGRYIYVADLHQVSQLKLDPQFQRLAVFLDDLNPLRQMFPGAVATVENLIVCESNRMPRLTNLGAGSNITGYQGLVLAPGAIGWGLAEDAHAITTKDDDGGRNAQFAWNAYEGWQVLDDNFVQSIITD